MQTNKPLNRFRPQLCLITLLCFFSSSHAQVFNVNRYIDSLKNVLPSLKDTGRIKCLNQLGNVYMLYNPDSSRFYSRMALRESEKKGYTKGIGAAHINLAWVENGIGGSNSVKEHHILKALDAYKKINDQYALSYCYNTLAYRKKDEGKEQQAIEYFKKGIASIEKTPATAQEKVIMYDGLGYFLQQTGNYKESFEYRKKSFELNKKINNHFGIILCLQNFGELFTEAGDKESATEYFNKVINYFHSNTFTKGDPTYRIVANVFHSLGNNDSALYYFDQALSQADSRDFDSAVKPISKDIYKWKRQKHF